MNRVQIKVYRGPNEGDATKYGYFIMQPAIGTSSSEEYDY
jgi:hypothetical protein